MLTIDCPVSPASCAGYIEQGNWTRPHIMWDPRPVVLACLLSPHFHHGKPQLHQTLHRVGSSASKSSIRMFIITEKAPTYHKGWAAIRHYANQTAFNQEKALGGAFSVIMNIRMAFV